MRKDFRNTLDNFPLHGAKTKSRAVFRSSALPFFRSSVRPPLSTTRQHPPASARILHRCAALALPKLLAGRAITNVSRETFRAKLSLALPGPFFGERDRLGCQASLGCEAWPQDELRSEMGLAARQAWLLGESGLGQARASLIRCESCENTATILIIFLHSPNRQSTISLLR